MKNNKTKNTIFIIAAMLLIVPLVAGCFPEEQHAVIYETNAGLDLSCGHPSKIFLLNAIDQNENAIPDTRYKVWLQGNYYLGDFKAVDLPENSSELDKDEIVELIGGNDNYFLIDRNRIVFWVYSGNSTKNGIITYSDYIKYDPGCKTVQYIAPKLYVGNIADSYILEDEDTFQEIKPGDIIQIRPGSTKFLNLQLPDNQFKIVGCEHYSKCISKVDILVDHFEPAENLYSGDIMSTMYYPDIYEITNTNDFTIAIDTRNKECSYAEVTCEFADQDYFRNHKGEFERDSYDENYNDLGQENLFITIGITTGDINETKQN